MLKYFALIFLNLFILSSSAFAQNLAKYSDIVPGMEDRDIERQAVHLANKQGTNYHWPEEYEQATIISRKWDLVVDNDGFSIGRKIHAVLYGKLPGGKCIMTDFTFIQKLQPNEIYSGTLSYGSVVDMVVVECE